MPSSPFAREPAEEDVARRLHQPLALDYAPALLLELLLPANGSSTEALRLLDLQEERIVRVAAEEQNDPGAGPDAADADDLVGDVDVAVALDQVPDVAVERSRYWAISFEQPLLDRLGLGPSKISSIGMISGGSLTMRSSPSTRRVSLAKARRLFLLSALATPCRSCLRRLAAHLRAVLLEGLEVDRSYQTSMLRIAASRRISSRYARAAAARPLGAPLLEAAIRGRRSRSSRRAASRPIRTVPGGLVEVVDVEDQPPVGRGEAAEVGEVGVAAELHVEVRSAGSRQGPRP